ncbi:hypothetical protein ILUMI_24613 [Ignelater luminosus]|uniref:Uncharacterized protein n=1 Tax=Ignelater luminosus TaxID=2038154 RepID=A0A8K0C8T5_IGNLU|nr:hypothetical protein ILUMI_24613 [Ignelater luminosus]
MIKFNSKEVQLEKCKLLDSASEINVDRRVNDDNADEENESHYSRTENRYKRYRASNMFISFLPKEYNKRHPDSQVKYAIFYRIFTEDYNFSFAHPRKDICTYCAKNNADLNSAKLKKDDALIKELTTSKELHPRRAQVFLDLLKSKKENPDNNELVICFDFEKNLPFSVTNISEEYYKRQLWLHNLGINNVLSNQATMFLFTENFAHKGPNEVVFLQHTLLTKFSDISKEYTVLKVKDYKKAYSSKIKAIPGISKCRSVKFSSSSKPIMRETMTKEYSTVFSLYKAGRLRIIFNVLFLEEACKRFIKLKQEKLENIKFLLGHIEVEENREFYKLLDEESSEVDNKIEDDANAETGDFDQPYVAQLVQCSVSVVNRTWARLSETGAFTRRSRQGRLRITSERTDRENVRSAIRNPAITGRQLTNEFARHAWNNAISAHIVRCRLYKADLRSRARVQVPCLNENHRNAGRQYVDMCSDWTDAQ